MSKLKLKKKKGEKHGKNIPCPIVTVINLKGLDSDLAEDPQCRCCKYSCQQLLTLSDCPNAFISHVYLIVIFLRKKKKLAKAHHIFRDIITCLDSDAGAMGMNSEELGTGNFNQNILGEKNLFK